MSPKTFNFGVMAAKLQSWSINYYSRCFVRDILKHSYHVRRRGKGGPTAWSPCSPGLYPLDFHLWGHLNNSVYAAPVDNKETFHHRILHETRAQNLSTASSYILYIYVMWPKYILNIYMSSKMVFKLRKSCIYSTIIHTYEVPSNFPQTTLVLINSDKRQSPK
jgi:hypothetical protein